MAIVQTFPSALFYNRIPFIHEMHGAAVHHVAALKELKCLLTKHGVPSSVCIKLIHIHYHLNEGEVLAVSEINVPHFGNIPFLSPIVPDANIKLYGCHFLVNNSGDLQPFEYTTVSGGVDLSNYPAFVTDFCAYISQHGLQHTFGLAIKSGAAKHGSWTELDFPEKRATFLLPGHVSIPESEDVVQKTTKTLFYSVDTEDGGQADSSESHSHTEHFHTNKRDGDELAVEGVTTKEGFFLTGIPLDPASDFYAIVSAISAAG